MAKTKNFDDVIRKELAADQELSDAVEQEILNARIAMELYRIRTNANLTQQQLADLVGTSQPVIARLEDADYYGRSLSLLHRIASALGCRIKLKFEKKIENHDNDYQSFDVLNEVFNWSPLIISAPSTATAVSTNKPQDRNFTNMVAAV